jgi:ankyrin repeat protein
MQEKVKQILERVQETGDFEGVDLADINACSSDGDNALHVVVRWNDIPAAELLIEAGIEINKPGDLGYTPLHVACMEGNLEMVKLLVGKGGDVFALSEGVPPFTSARLAGQDHICDFLKMVMSDVQSRDPQAMLHSRLSQLRREIALLEKKLNPY